MTVLPVRVLRVGTRASRLARAQTGTVIAGLDSAEAGIEIVTVAISTEGDRSSAALSQIGGTGVFVSALRDALVSGEIDVAVHSYKDLPTAEDDRVHVAAVPVRGDARDVLIARDGLTLGELPDGSTIGTGSPRRAAQLRALGMGLDVVAVRGNVDTRLAMVAQREVDAVVLAYAGLARLSRLDEVTEVLDPLQMLPAPAQGALAVECRADDDATIALLAPLDDADTRAVVTAERALLRALEAGCSSPVGALGEVAEGDDGPEIYLRASVTATDGSDAVRLSRTGLTTDAEAIGRWLATDLLAAGADKIMERST
jgi:hydroxymethylbilane synthase